MAGVFADAAPWQPAEPLVHDEGEEDEDCKKGGRRGGRPRTKDINQRLRQMYRERKSLSGGALAAQAWPSKALTECQ